MATGATTSMRSRVTALSLRAFTRLALVRALLALALSFVTAANADDRRAAHEVPLVDLSSIEDGTIFPRGTRWAVYPNVLVDETPTAGRVEFLPVPAHWSHDALADGQRLPAYGCHTFHVRARLPPRWLDGRTPLAVSFPYQFHAARVVVRNRGPSGGRWEVASGTPSCLASEETPLHRPVRLLFTADGDVDVFIQISNHHAMRGGLVRPPYIGHADAARARRSLQEKVDFFILGILGITSLAHLAQWLLRRSERKQLWFAAMCFVMAVRACVFGNYLEEASPPLIGFATSQRLVYLTIDGAVFFTIAFLDAALPRTLPKGMLRAFGIACGSLSALVIILDVTTFGPLIFFEQGLAATGSAIVIASCLRALWRDRSLYAALMLLSFLVLAGAAVSDIIIDQLRVGDYFVAPYGTMGFVLMQSFAIALQNARTRREADALSAQLAARSERLEQLDALKNEFLATTSHELRTPLNGIVGLSETLLHRASVRNDREATSHMLAIADAGRRLTSLIDDILDYSKLRTRKLVLDRKPVDPRRVIDQVMLLSRSLPGTKPIDLKQSVPHGLPYVNADENRLRQILQNLVGNAIKFTDRGFVEVAASVSGSSVEIRVRDSGIGIPEDKFDDIFATFEQLDMGPSRRAPGTGLGLAITKQLVELQGGTISVHSALGLGSTFVFTVPVATEAPTASVPAPSDAPPPPLGEGLVAIPRGADEVAPPSGTRWRILAVDDDAANLLVLRAQLDPNEYEVTPVRDARDAVRVFREDGPFDAVLLDVMMPKVSGLEVARELRRMTVSARCPILFLSARTALDDFAAAFGAGGSDFLTKPVVRTELLARLRHHLEVASAFRSLERPLESRLVQWLESAPERVAIAAVRLADDTWPQAPLAVENVLALGGAATFTAGDVLLALAPLADAQGTEPLRAALERAFGPTTGLVLHQGSVHLTQVPGALRTGPLLAGPAVDRVLREALGS